MNYRNNTKDVFLFNHKEHQLFVVQQYKHKRCIDKVSVSKALATRHLKVSYLQVTLVALTIGSPDLVVLAVNSPTRRSAWKANKLFT